LMSGTFEALLYDELDVRDATADYPRLLGWARSTAMLANLVASVAAWPLLELGGYPLLGWTSVGIVGVQLVLAGTLPVSRQARRPTSGARETTASATAHYLAMLRTGVGEAATHADVRRVLLVAAVLVGLTAYDEYFPLVARDHRVDTATVPLLIAVTVIGQAVGTALAGTTERLRSRTLAVGVALGGTAISAGALLPPYVGFVLIAVGYGMLNNAMLVAEARLQAQITGPARATVTSVHGLATEIVALAVYAGFALLAGLATVSALVAALGVPLLAVAAGVARWLPERRLEGRHGEEAEDSPVVRRRG
jgi:hypothetical protein